LSVAPLYKAPPPAMAPAYNWSGFYLGINGGGGWGHSNWDTSATRINTSGGMVGGTAGYNWQFGNAVLGLEGDIDWANLKGTNTSTLCPLGCSTSDTWLSTVRGRAGDIRAATPGFVGATNTSAGWTAGAGLEVGLTGNWSAKAEYLYVDLGKFNCGTACNGLPTDNVSMHDNVVRAGVNYRFDWGR
jgi:outer membrane immunogenic protein